MYCACLSPNGFYCILAAGHDGSHLSLDNSRMWKSTPGFPVIWQDAEVTEVRSEPPKGDKKAVREKALSLGYTGEFCTNCGSSSMRRAGVCMVCEACGTTTGCS